MRTRRWLLLSLVLIAAAPGDLAPYLVKDISPETSPASSEPRSFDTFGGLALFQVKKLGIRELWRSDGTASGTYRLADIKYMAGRCILPDTGGLCFFNQQDPAYHWHLWVTDGTVPGTFPLAETHAVEPVWMARQGILYFAAAREHEYGTALWRSDGTPGGTYEIADIEPNPEYAYRNHIRDLTIFQDRLYFTAGDNQALWRSDGTAQGTVQVSDVWAAKLRATGSRLVFFHGSEIWTSDGTAAGTRRIADPAQGEIWSGYYDTGSAGALLYFVPRDFDGRGRELYVTDGTARGTRRLASFAGISSLDPFSHALGARLLFAASDGTHGNELWSTDGTPEGTRMVLDACPGACSSGPGGFFQHKARLYYTATEETHGSELWVTDGTAEGTHMVADVCPGVCDTYPTPLLSPGERLLFASRPYSWTGPHTLWSTDGTPEGTVLVADNTDFSGGTAAGDAVIFSGSDPDHGREPWLSDGTREGTHLLADVADENVGGSKPHGLMPLGASVLFFAHDRDGVALWRSDGTDAGTRIVKRELAGTGAWTVSAGRVLFKTADGLWASDGTEAGTYRLTPEGIGVGELSAPVSRLGSRVFFSASSPELGEEPWITDGTPEGTRPLADLSPGPASSSPACFLVFRGRMWFGTRTRLWRSDGTAAGTVAFGPKLAAACPLAAAGPRLWYTGLSRRRNLELWETDGLKQMDRLTVAHRQFGPYIVHQGRLWYTDDDGLCNGNGEYVLSLYPEEGPWPDRLMSDGTRLYFTVFGCSCDPDGLWATDGTTQGTRKLSKLGFDGPWAALGGQLYLVSQGGGFYRTDGTRAGTRSVRPDGQPNHVTDLVRFGNRLVVFTADGEVWQTDGTAEGTKWLHGPLLASGTFVQAGSRLFFPALDPKTGWELWAMRE